MRVFEKSWISRYIGHIILKSSEFSKDKGHLLSDEGGMKGRKRGRMQPPQEALKAPVEGSLLNCQNSQIVSVELWYIKILESDNQH
jgi:hypothetical protein